MGSCCGASAEAKAAAVANGGFWAWVEKAMASLASWPSIAMSGVALLASYLLMARPTPAQQRLRIFLSEELQLW